MFVCLYRIMQRNNLFFLPSKFAVCHCNPTVAIMALQLNLCAVSIGTLVSAHLDSTAKANLNQIDFADTEGISLLQLRATATFDDASMSSGDVQHKGENCWVDCNGAGTCDWCGSGNACCQGSLDRDDDPAECGRGIPSTNAAFHECVAVTPAPPPADGEPEHQGENCWVACNGAGFCSWCGNGNACCQGSLDRDADPAECSKGIPSTNAKHHECVAVTDPPDVEHIGENCWDHCDPEGFCDWCGSGNACCQGTLDNDDDPEECSRGIPSTTANHHECVAVTPAPPAPPSDDASAVGDPHMTTNSGTHFDLP